MKKNIPTLLLLFILSCIPKISSEYNKSGTSFKECFVGSIFAMLGNFLPKNRPNFVQLNLEYRLPEKDVISLKLKTWKFALPISIPYGPLKEAPETEFFGYIGECDLALTYQHFWWKGLYTGVHVMNAWQYLIDENGQKIENGFQIFNTYRLGYHIKLFKRIFFTEPSIAITHRTYHTKMPESFKRQDDKHSKIFFGEPGLHFGFNF